MKKILVLLLLCVIKTHGQTYSTIYDGASGDIKIYIVSQGFTTGSIATFNSWATSFKDYLIAREPFASNLSRFDIITVAYTSGTTEHVPGAYFQFDNISAGDLHYYISVPTNHADYNQYQANECYTDFKIRMDPLATTAGGLTGWVEGKSYILAVFNNNYYTGGGGEYTFTSIFDYNPANPASTPNSVRVAAHEFGHTFGILGDEYTASGTVPYVHDEECAIVYDENGPVQISPDSFPLFHNRNVSPTNTPANIPWEYLLPETLIDAFAGATYSTSWYRPTSLSCNMHRIDAGLYCQVCRDLIMERIHEHTCDATVAVTEDFVSRHQYIMHWRKAATTLTSTSDIGNKISATFLSGGTVLLQNGFIAVAGSDFLAEVGDCSIIDLQNTYRPATNKGGSSTPGSRPGFHSIKDDPVVQAYIRDNLQLSPNPATNTVQLSFNEGTFVGIRIFSIDGKQVFNRKTEMVSSAEIDVSTLPNGSYIVEVLAGSGQTFVKTLIKN